MASFPSQNADDLAFYSNAVSDGSMVDSRGGMVNPLMSGQLSGLPIVHHMGTPDQFSVHRSRDDGILEPDHSWKYELCATCMEKGKPDISICAMKFHSGVSEGNLDQYFEFTTTPPFGAPVISYLRYRIVSEDTIRIEKSRQGKLNHNGCSVFRFQGPFGVYLHVNASQGGQFVWVKDDFRKGLVMLQKGQEFLLHIFSKVGGETCKVAAKTGDPLANMAGPSGPVQFPSPSISGKRPAEHTPSDMDDGVKRVKHDDSVPDDFVEAMEEDQFLELSPILDAPDRPMCEISALADPMDISSNFGRPIAVCAFTCGMHDGPKNLRQKASLLEISIFSTAATKALLDLKYVKFKVYADSTIRRGKKNLRRNCFLFSLGDGRVVHLMTTNSQAARKSLKWTIEKKERFLAFEGGVSYLMRVFSLKGDDEASIRLKQNGALITEWKDLIHPEKSIDIPPEHFGDSKHFPDWELEPAVWNLSMNTGTRFYATIISHAKPLPTKQPKVMFLAKDKKIDVRIEQYDMRNKKSFVISVPRLFSAEKAEEATKQGVNFQRDVDMVITDADGNKLWNSNFTYEVGLHEE